jgi:putative ABC transport system substrate-binding protein
MNRKVRRRCVHTKLSVFVLTACTLVCVHLAEAQQTVKVHRIGVLSEGNPVPILREIAPLRQSLRQLGYIEGRNIVFEYRNAEGKLDRLPDLAVELLHLRADVIVATSGAATITARQATSVVPIVMTVSGDPVRSGLAASLARPGGNVTGVTVVSTDLSGKRLEVLKETFAGISRVAVLWSTHFTEKPADLRETEMVARNLGLRVQSLSVEAPDQLDRAFEDAAAWGAQALIPLAHRFIVRHRSLVVRLATDRRMPAMYANRHFAEAGGLMSYGPNHSALIRRTAYFVDKILKGAKPAELPIEQPTKFELVINLKTAKQIGVTIPPEVLMWADEVIK